MNLFADNFSEALVLYKEGKPNKLIHYYDKACNTNNVQGCASLGKIYAKEGNSVKAVISWRKACNLGSADSCLLLGLVYDSRTKVISKNKTNDELLLNKMLKEIPQDKIKSKIFFDEACSLGNPNGCFFIAKIYKEEKNYIKAMLYFTIACNKNNAGGCKYLGRMYAESGSTEKALSFYRKACNLGNKKACKLISNFQKLYPN